LGTTPSSQHSIIAHSHDASRLPLHHLHISTTSQSILHRGAPDEAAITRPNSSPVYRPNTYLRNNQSGSDASIVRDHKTYTMAASALNEERELAIHPIVASSVQHNTQVISNIRSLTASLFGVAAGTLGLESYTGFIFYLLGSLVVSALLFALKTNGKPGAYFYRPLGDLWLGDVFGGLSGFVLTWTLFYGLVRA